MPPIKYKYNSIIFIMQLIRRLISFLYSKLPKLAILLVAFFAFKSTIFADSSTLLSKLDVVDYEGMMTPEFQSTTFEYQLDIFPNDYDLNIIFTKEDPEATVTIQNEKHITSSSGIINIIVSKEGLSSTEYHISFTKTRENVELTQSFSYTGTYQTFLIPTTAKYKIELWGASGGNYGTSYLGGKGAYTSGVATFKRNQELYFYIGGKGSDNASETTGGWNGGGNAPANKDTDGRTGGGSTDVRLIKTSDNSIWNEFESLKSRIMVAGGGGGAAHEGSTWFSTGGSAGGLTGYIPSNIGASSIYYYGTGGTQTSGGNNVYNSSGTKGYFGIGGNGLSRDGGSGGGGGYYGGGGSDTCSGGGGGSSFISGFQGCNAIDITSTSQNIIHTNSSHHYSGITFENTIMIDGEGYEWENGIAKTTASGMPTFNGNSTMYGNEGNGYAKITKLDVFSDNNYLQSITTSAGTLDPVFSIMQEKYTIKTSYKTSRINIDAVAEETEKAIISGTGEYELDLGNNEISISVTSEDGSIRIYEVTVIRSTLENEHTTDIYRININNKLTINTEENVYSYHVELGPEDIDATINAQLFDSEATYIVENNKYLNTNGTIRVIVSEPHLSNQIYYINYERGVAELEYKYEQPGEYIFVAPYTGSYKLETWGARGGGIHQDSNLGTAGAGGYSRGIINLNKNDTLYIYVGEQGDYCDSSKTCTTKESFNGGGYGSMWSVGTNDPAAGGGGATDIRLVRASSGTWYDTGHASWEYDQSLLSRIIVAGGGGGGGVDGEAGGAGGGLTGKQGYSGGLGGTQTTGFSFGKGADATVENGTSTSYGGPGAGGGWYGGKISWYHGGGGGSGFVWNSNSEYVPENYSVSSEYYLMNAITKSGSEKIPTYDSLNTMTGNNSDGYAKITPYYIDSNTYLSSVHTNKGNWNTNFDPLISDYNITLDTYDDEIEIDVETSSLKSEAMGTGKYSIRYGKPTTISILVVAESGDIRVYNFTINRKKIESDHSSKLGGLYVKDSYDNFNPTFNSLITEYTYEMSKIDYVLELEAYAFDDEATIKIDGEGLILSNSGTITITVTEPHVSDTIYKINYVKVEKNNEQSFDFTGQKQEYIIPKKGLYKIEAWGAQGGNAQNIEGGYGAYASGYVNFEKDEKIYIYVGESGATGTKSNLDYLGGFNGGGKSYYYGNTDCYSGSGGGATHISTVEGLLKKTSKSDLLLVAGSGGGAIFCNYRTGHGGDGGGISGNDGSFSSVADGYRGLGGTSISGGLYELGESSNSKNQPSPGGFGFGGDSSETASGSGGGAGGGSGYYGGGGATAYASAGGGTSYIGSKRLVSDSENLKHMTCYNCETSDNDETKTITTTNVSETPISDTAKKGNGYVKITYQSNDDNNYMLSIDTDKGVWNHSFDPTITNYTITLDKYDNRITIDGIVSSDTATVTGLETYKIGYGEEKEVVVSVTSGSGTVKNYNFNIIREKLGENEHSSKIADLKIQYYNESLNPIFSSNIEEYDLDLLKSDLYLNITAIPYDNEATVNIEGNELMLGTYGDVTITVHEPHVEDTIYQIHYLRLSEDKSIEYEYTGNVQTFVPERNGNYKLELWGARSGGNHQNSELGISGKGGYSTGIIKLNENDILYLYVGGQGEYCGGGLCTIAGGFNGGGYGLKLSDSNIDPVASGGGATDIRLIKATNGNWYNTSHSNWINDESLLSRIIVAGGGGGAGMDGETGGSGGGTTGGTGYGGGAGGTQTTGYAFGQGADATIENGISTSYGGSGAGGGWYGGLVSGYHGAGGGSGFVWTEETSNYVPEGYSVPEKYYLTNAYTLSASSSIPTYDGKETMTGNDNNGYIKISYVDTDRNNYLSILQTDIGNWSNAFDVTISDYNVILDSEEYKINVEARPYSDLATIEGTGEYYIPAGTTDIPVTVTAESGDIRVYTIHVTRPASSNGLPQLITISGLVPSYCAMDSKYCKQDPKDFNPNTTEYEITVPYKIKEIFFNVEKGHPYQSVNGEGAVTVIPNYNNFTVTVTSEDESNYSIYNYHVTRDMTGDNDLSILNVLYPGIELNFDPDITDYYFSVANTIDKYVVNSTNEYNDTLEKTMQLYYEIDDENATAYVLGDGTLKVGLNNVQVMVVAQNGETQTYTLNVYREPDTNIYLSEIIVRSTTDDTIYPLNPEFNKIFTGEYKAVVPKDVTTVNIVATPESNTTTVEGAGIKSLEKGENKFNITTTAQADGYVEIYSLNIIREKDNNANLSAIDVKIDGVTYSLNETFDSDIIDYTVTGPIGGEIVTITPTLSSEFATYRLLDNDRLVPGDNLKRILVTAEDGTTKTYNITITRPVSEDKDLKSLAVYDDNNDYISVTTPVSDTYNLTVENDISWLNVLGVSNSDLATVMGNGRYNLKVGLNEITVKVTSESKEDKLYKVNITRKPNTNGYLESIVTSAGNVSETVTHDDFTYTLTVPNEVSSINVNGVPEVSTTNVTGNGRYDLVTTAENTITLTTLAEDGITSYTYTIKITREKNANANLESLYAREGILSPVFNKNTTEYNMKVPYNVTDLTLHYTPEASTSTVSVNGGTGLVEGNNTVTLTVTAEDGTTKKDYEITVRKQSEDEVSYYLSNLVVSEGTLTPVFNKTTLYYEVDLPYETTSINVIGTAEDEFATVTGNGNYSLLTGDNLIVITVTGSDNETTTDYQVMVRRAKNDEARLANVVISNITNSLGFDKDQTGYVVTTRGNALDFTTITPIDSNATYVVTGNSFDEMGNYTVLITVTAEDGVTTKDYEFAVTRIESDNNRLSSLSVEGYNFTQSFDPNVTTYYLNTQVADDVNSVNVIATAAEKHATITGDGIRNLVVGRNTLEVTVTSENDVSKTYKIILDRLGNTNNRLTKLDVLNGTMDKVYSNDVSSYNVSISYFETALDLDIELENDKASYTVIGNENLKVGANTVRVVVTSENGDIRNITLNVTREEAVSALLEDLKVDVYPLLPEFDMYTFKYNVIVDNEVTSLNLTPKTLDKNATYVINNNSNFVVGNNPVEIVVTSSNGVDTETYTLNVIRQAYANNFLSSLTTSEGDLTPTFDKYTMVYSIDVGSEVDTIELIGTAEESGTVINGLGNKTLVTGENKFTVSTSKNGITRNYYISVNKEEDNDNLLLTFDAIVSGESQTLTPEFDSKTGEYSITVPASTEKVNFQGTISEGATQTGLGIRDINLGNNELEVIVTSSSNKPRTYKFNVYRPVSTNTDVTNIIPSSGSLSPTFDNDEDTYTLNLGSNIETLSFTVNTSDKFATVSGNGSLSVPVGSSQRTITITAEDETTTKEYTINVNRASTDNADLSNLYVQGYDFIDGNGDTVTFDPSVTDYYIVVPNSKVTLTPNEVKSTLSDPNANMVKDSTLTLFTKTDNVFKVTVTSYDGEVTKEYKIHVTREKSNLIELDSLSTDKGKLSPEFTPGTKTYDLYVYTDETDVTISAEPANEDITITSGTGLVNITEDNQEHKIYLEAENGDTGYYSLNIHRSILTDEGLSDLDVKNKDNLEQLDTEFVLSTEFDTDTLFYEISVPYEYKILDVFYETMNDQQTVKFKIGDEYVEDFELVVGNNNVKVEVYDGLDKLTRTYNLKVIRNKSRNTYLKQLEITGYELTPEFVKTTQEYYIRVPVEITDLDLEDIIAVPEDELSQTIIKGYRYLVEGNNDLTIEVVSDARTIREYIVHVIRGADKESDLKNITVSTGVFWQLEPKFKRNVYDYTVTLPGVFDKATVEAVVDDSNLVDIEGIGEYPLVTGNNIVVLTATSTITGQISVYTINIVKEPNEDVDLVNLSAKEGTLNPGFDRGTTKYKMNVGSEVDSLTLSYETSAKTAKVYVAGNSNFVSGENKVSIVVTNYEGTKTKTYQIIVTKAKNANPRLSGIRVYEEYLEDEILKEIDYDLDPEFDSSSSNRTYDVEVPYTTEKVIVEANAIKNTTNVLGNGEVYLNYGNNVVELNTTAENGNKDKYTINIYRNYNLNLESLVVSEGTLVPDFRSDITEYTINVENEIKSIYIVGSPESTEVEVLGNGSSNLLVEDNTRIITVKAPDNKTKTYTITINRAKNSNNYIRELQVNGIIKPIFEKTTQVYDIDVRPDVTSLDLDVTLDAETSTYEILNNTLSADNNPNTVTIRVTAENGDQRDYVLTVMVRDWAFFSNRLRDLKVDHGQLTPDFNADINNYAVTVENSIDVLGIEAIKQHSDQKVTINVIDGATQFVNLQVGRNVIPITVTDQFGLETSDYSLIVYRLEATDASLANLVVEGHQFYPYFNKKTYSYSLNIESDVTDLNVIATPTDPNSTVEITGNTNIPSGKSIIKVKVTAPNGINKKEYIINVDKTKSTNNYLTDIQVKDYELNETFIKTNQGVYTASVPSNVTNVLIKGIPEVKTTTVSGDGVVFLNKGRNIITITATAENGDSRNYTLAITRELASDSSLADILLSDGDLDPEFNTDTLVYEVEVDEDVEEVTITGIPTDPNAKVIGNGTYDLTEDEETTVDLVVTAEDGVSKTTYKVKFIRHINASSYLSSLVVKDGELYPNFHKLITAYTILVPNEVRSLNMIYTPEDPDATVEVTGNSAFSLGTNKVYITVTAKDNSSTTEYVLSVIRQAKGSNYLSDLIVTSADLSTNYPLIPVFDKGTLYYEVTVPADTSTVSINAQVEDLNSTLRGSDLGVKSLNKKVTRHYVQVESQSGVIRTYQILITKEDSENKLLTLESDKGTLNPTFDSDKYNYTLTISKDVTELTLSGTATDGSTIDGLGNITIDSDPQVQKVIVTKEEEEKTYTITIVKETDRTSTDLKKFIPSSGTLSPSFTNDNDNYEIEVDDGVGVISFEVEPENDKATITGNDVTTIGYGDNNITILVTAEDGETTREIKVKVIRTKKLQRIDVEKTDIKLAVNEEHTIVYTLVPADATNKEVEFITSDEDIATVSNSGVIKGISVGTTTVKVVSKTDSNIYKIITVRVLNKKITSQVYTIERFEDKTNDSPENYEGEKMDYTLGAEPDTTIEDYIKNFDNDPATLFIYDLEGNKISDTTQIVGTGMKIKLIIDEEVCDELTISVRGDLDGDGIVAMPDYAKFRNQLLGELTFNYVQFKASDVDFDEVLAMPDYGKMKNFLLGIIGTLNE